MQFHTVSTPVKKAWYSIHRAVSVCSRVQGEVKSAVPVALVAPKWGNLRLILGCTILAISVTAAAQVADLLRVYVTDQQGLPIVGAKVSTSSSSPETCTTDGTGHCALKRPGSLSIDVSANGFSPEHVTVANEATTAVTLHIRTSESVVASASEDQLNPPSAAARVVLEAEEVDHLPVWLRTTDGLLTEAPGTVARPTDDEWGQGVSAAGTRLTMTNSTLDGTPNRAERRGGLALQPSLDSIADVNILTSGYSAEYGHTPGAQAVLTTKSGSSEVHGSVYDYARDRFGGVIGGPIRRAKSYFFFSYEGNRMNYENPVTSDVPRSSELGGDFISLPAALQPPAGGQTFSGNTIPATKFSPLARKLLPLIPASSNGLAWNVGERGRGNQLMLRLDDQISASSRLMLRLARGDSSTVLQPYGQQVDEGTPASWPTNRDIVNSIAVSYNREKANTAQSVRASYLDSHGSSSGSCHYDQQYSVALSNGSPTAGCPIVSIAGFQPFGDAFHLYSYRSPTADLATDLKTTVHGRNSLKVGIGATEIRYSAQDPTEENGYLSFSGQYTGNAVADFLLGMPATAVRVFDPQRTKGSLRQITLSSYVQDSIRITPSFSVDLGVRIEYLPQMVGRNSNLTSFWPQFGVVESPSKQTLLQSAGMNFSPRLGFTWRPFGGNTILRGGVGKFIGEDDLASTLGQLTDAQLPRSTLTATAAPQSINSLNPTWVPISDSVTRGIDPRNLLPAVYQYTLTLEYRLPGGIVADASYLGSRGEHLGRLFNINQALPTGAVDSSGMPILVRPFANFGDVLYEDHGASSSYNAGRIELRKQPAKGLTLHFAYTFSKSIDDASAVTERNWSSIEYAQDPRHLDRQRALSDFDHRQQLSGFLVLQLDRFTHYRPFSRSSISVADNTMSGQPFTPLVDDNLLPDVVGNPYKNVPAGHYFNPAAFVAHVPTQSQPYYFGNAGRNSLVGSYFNTIDAAFNKGFKVKRFQIDLRIEGFNILNRNVPSIVNYVKNPDFGAPGNFMNQSRLVIAGARLTF